MRFTVLTLFPEYFESPLKCSLLGKAIDSKLVSVDFMPLRSFGEGKYRAVDDRPYGGGQGMVLLPTVAEKVFLQLLGGDEKRLSDLESSVQKFRSTGEVDPTLPFVLYLSPQGESLSAASARSLASTHSHLVLLCGHYEGIDERILTSFVHKEVSVGDYVLTGGEPAALVLIDTLSRYIPGVVGDIDSVNNDTFEQKSVETVPGGLKAPSFTRPQEWRGKSVPPILLSGNHGEISKWRLGQSIERTTKWNIKKLDGKSHGKSQ